MALTGNIEVFPLPEILRLLARAGKNGCLQVDAGDANGRIYLRDGAISVATVSTDGELLDQLAAAGIVDLDRLGGGDSLDLQSALTDGKSPDDLTEAVREHTVEALYRVRRPGRGTFEFAVDTASRFATGQTYDIEAVVADSDRRAADWAEVERTLDDLDVAVRMVRELPTAEVTVNSPTWRVLSVLEGGRTVREIARQLGTTEFRAAREVAALMRSSLVEPVPTVLGAPTPIAPSTEPVIQPEAVAADAAATHPEPASSPWAIGSEAAPEESPDPWAQPADVHESSEETVDPWPSPQVDDAQDDPTPDTEPETKPVDTGAGWWAEAMGEPAPAEPDTDEFLESVFAEEEGDGDPEEETGFAVGLLRRRRLGPMSRDISD